MYAHKWVIFVFLAYQWCKDVKAFIDVLLYGQSYANLFSPLMSQILQHLNESFSGLDYSIFIIFFFFVMSRTFQTMNFAGCFNGTQTSYTSKHQDISYPLRTFFIIIIIFLCFCTIKNSNCVLWPFVMWSLNQCSKMKVPFPAAK